MFILLYHIVISGMTQGSTDRRKLTLILHVMFCEKIGHDEREQDLKNTCEKNIP